MKSANQPVSWDIHVGLAPEHTYLASMRSLPYATPQERRQAIHSWLTDTFNFTHFLTLATNSSEYSLRTMRDRLRAWDGRVNRRLYGPKWHAHFDECVWYFGFLEKPDTNPHWHLLMRFDDHAKIGSLTEAAHRSWLQLVPSGTTDVVPITEKPAYVNDYVLKRVGHEVEYEHFITPDEFRRS